MGTWDVKIPKANAPKFPQICIGCGESPTTAIKLKRDAIGWWSVMRFGWLYGIFSGRTVDIPACAPCRKRLRREHWLKDGLEWMFIIAGLVVGIWLVR